MPGIVVLDEEEDRLLVAERIDRPESKVDFEIELWKRLKTSDTIKILYYKYFDLFPDVFKM